MKKIKFEKNGKIFTLKAIVCENKDLIKFMNRDYFLNYVRMVALITIKIGLVLQIAQSLMNSQQIIQIPFLSKLQAK